MSDNNNYTNKFNDNNLKYETDTTYNKNNIHLRASLHPSKGPPSSDSSNNSNDNGSRIRSSRDDRKATAAAAMGVGGSSTYISSTLHYSSYRMSYGMRAKSECNLTDLTDEMTTMDDNEQYRSTEDNSSNASSALSSSVGGRADKSSYGLASLNNRENHFLSAAKKWASYDKTPYISPFARDSWKRTHRKFNYSRFLNYTRETFV